MGEPVLYEAADGVARIILNRPDKLNAYTVEMGEAAYAAFSRARDDDDVRSVILTGAGRGFCSGVDLDALKAYGSASGAPAGPRLGEEAFVKKLPLELLTWPKPVVAAINGVAVGVGATMLLPCDVRIAAAGAKIGFTFAKLGILPGLGSTHLLPRLVGRGRALELVLTARIVLAEEAAEMGLVNRVVPGAALLDEARALAAQMAELDPAVLAAAKRALTYGESASMEEAMRNEAKASAQLREARKRKA